MASHDFVVNKKKIHVGRINGGSHDLKFKKLALIQYEKSGFNTSQTSRQLGVTRATLIKWRKQYAVGAKISEKMVSLKRVVAGKEKQIKDMETQRINDWELLNPALVNSIAAPEQVQMLAQMTERQVLERIRKVITNSDNLDHLGRCLEIVHRITTNTTRESERAKNLTIEEQNNQYVQIITNQILKVEEDLQCQKNQQHQETLKSRSLAPSPSRE